MFKYSLNGREMSLDELIGAVKKYGEELPDKAGQVRDKAAEELKELAEIGFNGAGYDYLLREGPSTLNVPVRIEESDNGNAKRVIAEDEEHKASFVEFGAGVYFNGPPGQSPHPWGDKGPWYIGEYGLGLGKRRVWGFYGPDGKLHLTHGTPASMPMYHATQTVRQDLLKIARDVFKGGGSD